MQDNQNQTSKENTLTSHEPSFAPLNPSDLRDHQKISVAGESPVAFNGTVGLFNTVKVHHTLNQAQSMQNKKRAAEARKGNTDLEIHYPAKAYGKDQKAKLASREATPTGSLDEEKML